MTPDAHSGAFRAFRPRADRSHPAAAAPPTTSGAVVMRLARDRDRRVVSPRPGLEGCTCSMAAGGGGSPESHQHLEAKAVLERLLSRMTFVRLCRNGKCRRRVCEARFDAVADPPFVELQVTASGSVYRVDVGGRTFVVEVYVTHRCSLEKLAALRAEFGEHNVFEVRASDVLAWEETGGTCRGFSDACATSDMEDEAYCLSCRVEYGERQCRERRAEAQRAEDARRAEAQRAEDALRAEAQRAEDARRGRREMERLWREEEGARRDAGGEEDERARREARSRRAAADEGRRRETDSRPLRYARWAVGSGTGSWSAAALERALGSSDRCALSPRNSDGPWTISAACGAEVSVARAANDPRVLTFELLAGQPLPVETMAHVLSLFEAEGHVVCYTHHFVREDGGEVANREGRAPAWLVKTAGCPPAEGVDGLPRLPLAPFQPRSAAARVGA
ncbi:hypothetical protein JKP88DRAFT_272181 [Tribonema minus]|uniref:Uncharacterized protein n=1 Tax=Tribonema minus TaxID=303371 RepID=A0A836CRE6_9STRA|nr:hypothetical protein JKP88DRAFT_272181 [Tribonema minus]